MTPTSDERREVAATMRLISGEGVHDLTLGEVLNSILTGGAPRPTTEMAILARLADLIDRPTCQMKSIPESGYRVCSRCGAFVRRDSVTDCTEAIPARFCPNCGARVVES